MPKHKHHSGFIAGHYCNPRLSQYCTECVCSPIALRTVEFFLPTQNELKCVLLWLVPLTYLWKTVFSKWQGTHSLLIIDR